MFDIVTNGVPVSNVVEWRSGAAVPPSLTAAPISETSDDMHLTIVALLNRRTAGATPRMVSDALAEATGLPPRLSWLDVLAPNDNVRCGVTVLSRYRLNRTTNSFIGGRRG